MKPSNTPRPAALSLPFYYGQPHPCPYLAPRQARDIFTIADTLDPAVYQGLMDGGFRRSGGIVYRPICDGCRECVPIRVSVDQFSPSRSQRRVLRRNAKVQVEIGPPVATDEKWNMFVAYLRMQHDGAMSEDREGFERFLYKSPTHTVEMTYFIGGRLFAAGIVDVCPASLSSVYFYFDPVEARRSPGTFGALREIEECRRMSLPYWYVGFYIRDCHRMNYKTQFRPYELLSADGHWHSINPQESRQPM